MYDAFLYTIRFHVSKLRGTVVLDYFSFGFCYEMMMMLTKVR